MLCSPRSPSKSASFSLADFLSPSLRACVCARAHVITSPFYTQGAASKNVTRKLTVSSVSAQPLRFRGFSFRCRETGKVQYCSWIDVEQTLSETVRVVHKGIPSGKMS